MAFDLEKISKGDTVEFKKLFHHFYKRVYGYVFKQTQDTYLTQEIISQTFVKLWEKRDTLRKIENLDAYIYRMAKNSFLNHMRSQKPHEDLEQVDLVGEDDFEIDVFKQELYAQLYELVELLPEKRKEIFTKVVLQRMSYAEVAEILNVSVNTVKTQRKLAIDFLKKHLL